MQAALKRGLISVEDYLAGEESSKIKHEYVGGVALFRRANQWRPEVFNQIEATLSLGSLGLALPLAAIYDGAMPD
jgi:hypothetical protein